MEALTQYVTEVTLGCTIKSWSIRLTLQPRVLKEPGKQLLAVLVFVASLNSRGILSIKVGEIFKRANEMTWISIS